MARSIAYYALCLRVKQSGESNREAWFLSAEEGLIRATVFGGAKSRLRSQVAPFHEGKLLIYHDPVKDFRKVTDFDVLSWRPGIRELWERAMTAGVLAETILSSQGSGGNWPEAQELAGATLEVIGEASAAACPQIAVFFLWRWVKVLGFMPDLSHCANCDRAFAPEEVLVYSGRKEGLFCENCFGNSSSQLRIGPESRLWLTEIETLPPSALKTLPADSVSLKQAKALSQAVLTLALGRRLSTWDGV